MRAEHTGQKNRRPQGEMENINADKIADHNGDKERERTEYNTLVPVVPELLHVDLKSRKKHDVQQPCFGQQFKTVGRLDDMQRVGANDHPGQDQTNNAGYAKTPEQQRREKNNKQRERQDEYRIFKR